MPRNVNVSLTSREFQRAQTDSIAVTGAPTNPVAFARNPTDSLAVSGNPTLAAAYARNPSDPVSVSGNPSLDFSGAPTLTFPGIDFAVGADAAGYTSRTTYTGPNPITTNGTVVTGKNISGGLEIAATNVTIQGCRITGSVGSGAGIYINARNLTGTHILDTTLQGSTTDYGIHTPSCTGGIDIRRCWFNSQNTDGFKMSTGPHTFHDNYIQWVAAAPDGAHADGIEWWDGEGSEGAEMIGNTIIYPYGTSWSTSCSSMGANGPTDRWKNVTCADNLFGGMTSMIYIGYYGNGASEHSNGLTFTGNRFTTSVSYGGLFYTPGTGYSNPTWGTTPDNNTWRDNRWYDGPDAGKFIWPNESTNLVDFM